MARDIGFDAVDVVGLRGLCEHVPVNGTRADFREAAAQFVASGLRAASVNADPGSFDGFDDLDDVHGRVDRLLEFAVATSTPLLVLPAGEKTDVRVTPPPVGLLAEGFNRAAERARSAGVRLAVEAPYFGRPIDRVDRASALLDALDPDIQLAFDVSHIEAADESVIDAWNTFMPRIGIVHFRDAVSGDIRRVIGRGRVDFGGVMHAIDSSDYGGAIVLELETRNSPYASKEDEVNAAVEYLDARRGR
ncbi:sugar phosphate isomerase/epimerase family protein [Microbacterium sp. 4R-513]|uniref:sugar phosphate isomerase/epimerase family protein n=1 Tax=Microbacterium sp. 4R-513 TaxID=2567934 RepID=UPI0019D03E3C|nr:sugar phosphate isomerase/epimerase family protein [Microbacterium sp. 4R-513]